MTFNRLSFGVATTTPNITLYEKKQIIAMKSSHAKIYPDMTQFQSNRLSDALFAQFSNLIQHHTGIKMTPSKRTSIEGKLRKRARILDFQSIEEYANMVFERGGLDSELEVIVDLATTNKTDFFREPTHFDLLEKTLVPALLAARSTRVIPRLKIWSAASSNGAEAFTIAIVLAELAAYRRHFEFSVLGTDISSEMISEARTAIYPAGMIDPVPEALQCKYFMRGRDTNSSPKVRVTPELRNKVHFSKENLISKSLSVDKDIDVIFLRNVLIYFDPPTQKKVVRRLAEHLRPSGYLILGHTEAAIGNEMDFEQVGTGVFCVK